MSKQDANKIIAHFCNFLEISPLSFDSKNQIELNVDGDIGVIVEYSEEINSILFNILISPINISDVETRNDLLYDIMCGNYLWGFTAGGTLGIDNSTQILCLSRLIEVLGHSHEECTAFLDLFASLVGAARYWRDYVSGVETISPQNNTEIPPQYFIKA